jgi:hypothetical protein
MRIRFKSMQIYGTNGPKSGPRFVKGEVIDETVIVEKLNLRAEPTAEWKAGFLNRWLQRGVAEEVGDDVPLGAPEGAESEEAPSDAAAINLKAMTKVDLRAYAAVEDIDLGDAKTNAEIIAAIEAATAAK